MCSLEEILEEIENIRETMEPLHTDDPVKIQTMTELAKERRNTGQKLTIEDENYIIENLIDPRPIKIMCDEGGFQRTVARYHYSMQVFGAFPRHTTSILEEADAYVFTEGEHGLEEYQVRNLANALELDKPIYCVHRDVAKLNRSEVIDYIKFYENRSNLDPWADLI